MYLQQPFCLFYHVVYYSDYEIFLPDYGLLKFQSICISINNPEDIGTGKFSLVTFHPIPKWAHNTKP